MLNPTAAPASTTTRHDAITIGAMAVLAYLLGSITHEVLGHGLFAVLLGAHPTHVTSLDLAYDAHNVGAWSNRIISAAGCGVQLIVATTLFVIFRRTSSAQADRKYFLWLLTFINFFIPFGYLMALSLAPFGDWNDFVQGLPQPVLWRLALTIIGVAGSFWALFTSSREAQIFLGSVEQERGRRALAVFLLPYLVGSTINTLAGILNPDGAILVLTSAAAATFGGTAFLAWSSYVAPKFRAQPTTATTAIVTRQTGWIAAGVVATLIYFFVLGPGIPRQ